jgi:MFS family permease
VTGVAPGRLISWFITAVLVGWVVVYNVMRVAGSTPADAALPSFLIGAAIGIVVLVILVVVRKRLIATDRLHPVDADADVPDPSAVTPDQRRVLSAAWPIIAVAAVVQLATGLWMLFDWQGTPAVVRATAELIMAIWFIFAAGWMGWEARNLRDMDAGGIDSVALGALLTAVLAGVGISRQFVTGMQVITVIVAGVASVIAYWLVWYLVRRRGVPTMAIIAGLISLAALFLPLLTR